MSNKSATVIQPVRGRRTVMTESIHEQLAKALAPLAMVKQENGEPLAIRGAATEAYSLGQAYLQRIVRGESLAAQRLRGRRFKG